MKMIDETPGSARAAENSNRSGNGVLIGLGVVVLLGTAGGILWWVSKRDNTPLPPTTVAATASTSATAAPEPTLDLPPLPTAEPDTGVDTGVDAAQQTGSRVAMGGGGCGGTCNGSVPTELRNYISGRGAAAKLCYRAALESQEGLAGEISVSLRIGPDGSLCSASIVSDSVGNAQLASCVKQKMQATYPAPKGGCVDQRVTISFKPQQK